MDLLNNLLLNSGLPFSASELIFGLLACIAAMSTGVFMAKRQARAFNGRPGEVNFYDYGDMRFLHLGSTAVQGSMKISQPFEIHLEYVQRMMAWLLFVDLDRVNQLHAMQLGLGAASLTKFCHLRLNMQTTAVELNPQVIETCRLWFNLPEDNAKLQVIQSDAADVARDTQWHGKIDVLQVDLYDQEAARPVLDSEDFYRDCRHLLTSSGCMTVNLFGHASSYEDSLKNMTNAFGQDCVWAFKPTSSGNSIVLAFSKPQALDKNALTQRAKEIQARWHLPANKWLKSLMPPK